MKLTDRLVSPEDDAAYAQWAKEQAKRDLS